MNSVTITINGKKCTVKENRSILRAAKENGIGIPTLCYMEDVNYIGSCRLCMVEIEGYENLFAACKTRVKDGMVIRTESETLTEYRREMLRLILADHRVDCMSCAANGRCLLQEICAEYGVRDTPYAGTRGEIDAKFPVGEDDPYLCYDAGKCIHCQRCVNACQEIACNGALKNGRTGTFHLVDAPFGKTREESGCETCGICASVCPTGALTLRRDSSYRLWETRKVLTTCPGCSAGCQMYLTVKDGGIVGAEGADGPVNGGRLCGKGRVECPDAVRSPERLTRPLIRDRESGLLREASWDEAVRYAAENLLKIREKYGPDSLAAAAGAGLTNEDLYMVRKTAQAAFGTDNAAVRRSSGGPAAGPVRDLLEGADCIFLAGCDPERTHPVIGMLLRRAVMDGTRLIAAGPEEPALAEEADVRLKIRPGTEAALIGGMMSVIEEEGLADLKRKEPGVAAGGYTAESAAGICGTDPDRIREAARMYAAAERSPVICGPDPGTLPALAALAGKDGRPGCGVSPLCEEANGNGAREMAAVSGRTAEDLFAAAAAGKIRGMLLCGTDAETEEELRALESLDFLAVSDMFPTEAARRADVVLPSAAWAEKEGTFTNTEGRVQRVRRAAAPAGESRPETEILTDLMNAMGCPRPKLSPAEIMDEIASVTPAYAGISHAGLDAGGSPLLP